MDEPFTKREHYCPPAQTCLPLGANHMGPTCQNLALGQAITQRFEVAFKRESRGEGRVRATGA
jgi:hypothetical protein